MSLLKRISVFSLVVTTMFWAVGLSFVQVAKAATYPAGSLIAQQGVSGAAVYFIGENDTKFVFPDPKTYFTWYTNFDAVIKVPVSVLDEYSDGGAVTYRPGTKLVTHPDTAKVYAIEPGGVTRWITSAADAAALWGSNWASRVQDVIPGFFSSSYTSGSDLGSTFPTGSLVAMGGTTYYVDGSDLRPFATADAFEANGFNWADVVTISSTAGYGTGSSITGEETDLSGFMGVSTPGGGTGSGSLTVQLASDTPSTTIVPANAARVPFTKVNLINTGSTDVTVDQLVMTRGGIGQDGAFSSLDLLDSTMTPLNDSSKTLGSVHTATFNDDFVVPANSTFPVYLAANMASSLGSYAGELPTLGVSSVTLKNGTVSGSFPVVGNPHTLNGTVTIGTVTVSAGGNNPSAATKEVGTSDYTVTSVKLAAGSAEDITVKRIVFTNNGSSDPEDVADIKLVNANTNTTVATKATITSDKIMFDNLNYNLEKGKNVTYDLKLDIEGGSASTLSYDIDKQGDVTATGQQYGFNILPSYPNSGEPYFNANDTTVGDGSLRIESLAVTPNQVTEGLDDVVLGKFNFVAKGEAMNITSIGWNFVFTTTGSTNVSDLTNVRVVDPNGVVVAGPVDPASDACAAACDNGTATTTDTITVPVGETTYTVRGDLSTDWTAGDTIQAGVSIVAATVRGDVTGNTITATPAGVTQSTALEIKSADLNVSVSTSPAAQTVVAGVNDFHAFSLILDASQSGDTVEVTSIRPILHTATGVYPNQISGWELWDGSTQLTIDSESTTCGPTSCNTAGDNSTTTLTLANDALLIAPGATKTITGRVNVGTGATSGSFSIGLQPGTVTAVDSDAQTVTPDITASNGQSMTLAAGGTLNVAVSADPAAAAVVAGSTTEVGRFTLQAKNEAMDINALGFDLSTAVAGGIDGGADEMVTLYLYEDGGSTALGSIAVSTERATITPASLGLSQNEEKTYVVKAKWASLSDATPAESGAGVNVKLSYIDVDGTSAGSSSVTVSGIGTTFSDFHVYKSLPTVTQLDVTDTITGDSVTSIKKFSVTADSAGPVGLWKFTFDIATTTVSLSTTMTNWYLYESSSSGTLGNIISTGADLVLTANADTSDVVEAYLDVNNDCTGCGEHRILTAGSTRYYTLRALVSGHDGTANNETISTTFLGDAAYAATARENAGLVDGDSHDDFIWSDLNFDLYSTTTATQNIGWFNGYRVPGMDNTASIGDVVSD